MRDAEIAHVISAVVRGHHLTQEETEKVLLKLCIPRASNIARISVVLTSYLLVFAPVARRSLIRRRLLLVPVDLHSVSN